jgi:transcriptional regulator with XRE-family HTH domain
MEVAIQADTLEDLAVDAWFTVPSSTTARPVEAALGQLPEQSSTTPSRWLPRAFASALLATLCLSVVVQREGAQLARGTSQFTSVFAEFEGAAENAVASSLGVIEQKTGLTRSQIAEALDVERPTLYQWLRGSQPRQPALVRIAALRDIATEWDEAALGSARSAWSMRIPGEPTLGELLKADRIDAESVRRFMRQLQAAPDAMTFADPAQVYGFPAENEIEEKRRRTSFFPPVLPDAD